MFILYGVAIAVILGLLAGGRIERLGELRLRWPWLAIAGLVFQGILFSAPVTAVVGDAGPPLYVVSTGLVLATVLRNVAIPGLVAVAAGAASNLAAILANGGYMPADPAALAIAEKAASVGYSNSRVLADPALAPLTDVFGMPAWVPFANVFSVGDVLIGVGVAVTVLWAVLRRPTRASDTVPNSTDGLYGGTLRET
ncbi:MAG: DUF5317 domain-containing protein [Chloroflexota bacterium]|nr:DUF5317 domain-containing protein [Chloroflexota bacterium]